MFEPKTVQCAGDTQLSMVRLHPNLTRNYDFILYDDCGSAIVPDADDQVRVKVRRLCSSADYLEVTETANANGSVITHLGSGRYRIRFDGDDITFSRGLYSLTWDYLDGSDGNDWKRAGYYVLTVLS